MLTMLVSGADRTEYGRMQAPSNVLLPPPSSVRQQSLRHARALRFGVVSEGTMSLAMTSPKGPLRRAWPGVRSDAAQAASLVTRYLRHLAQIGVAHAAGAAQGAEVLQPGCADYGKLVV
ncbi:hypothetical protein [Xylophilus sp. GOD-11R]|uniref:hypothetical protein n=1 Tax=Xylophilus sp. GOD-11R TaxID=3089814 RepID=UPI00298C8277|nr:hypothetical protein [Xylophilus sp. GOD-11R]WPB59201.1 hypothetical protein R9X41_11365 [Xylophilus sp. GOD-11R]